MARIRFEPDGIEVEVPAGITILEAARKAGAQVGSACGGVCACSTCHVYVKQGFDSLSEQEEKEEDILDKAFDVRANSRLGCQAQIRGEGDIECEVTRESLDAFYNEHPNVKDPRKT